MNVGNITASVSQLFDRPRAAFENLNEREQRLVTIMGIVFIALAVLLPLFLAVNGISSMQRENDAIRAALRDMDEQAPAIAERIAKRKAEERLYANPTPPLGTFLESQAKQAGYDRPPQTTDEPEKVQGQFTRYHTRASLSGVGLAAFLNMLTAIKNSAYPVAIERLQIEHYQTGDKYNAEVGIFAFEKKSAGKASDDGASEAAADEEEETNGPPSP